MFALCWIIDGTPWPVVRHVSLEHAHSHKVRRHLHLHLAHAHSHKVGRHLSSTFTRHHLQLGHFLYLHFSAFPSPWSARIISQPVCQDDKNITFLLYRHFNMPLPLISYLKESWCTPCIPGDKFHLHMEWHLAFCILQCFHLTSLFVQHFFKQAHVIQCGHIHYQLSLHMVTTSSLGGSLVVLQPYNIIHVHSSPPMLMWFR